MQAYKRLCANRNSLLPHLREDASIQPPFAADQITEHALRHESQRILSESTGHTRNIYELGIDRSVTNLDNWVVRWLLWHIILLGSSDPQFRRRADIEPTALPSVPTIDAKPTVLDHDSNSESAPLLRQLWLEFEGDQGLSAPPLLLASEGG